ncbi:hypothetical protein TrLO_g12613 [Triparma laevis f. longispina]|uniref:Fatty acid desaturase domain-containing protein n=1 Tax=Triparma laevis f. longispina TaxID=1714387 RepID=A0A9W6ZCK3_9STRA|nr:hypothetical protein TrLO_g12613 [Triparma laevis f. longispina]
MCPPPSIRRLLPPKPPNLHLPSHYSSWFIADALICAILATLSISLAIHFENPYLPILTGLLEAKLGLIAHEASHGAAPKWLGWLYDAAMGSKSQWIAKHNKQHHILTNTLNDPDIQLSPVMRIHPDQPYHWIHKYQHLYQFPLFCLIPFGLRLQGVIYLHLNCPIQEIIQHWILAAPASYLYFVWPLQKYGGHGIIYFLVENFTVGLVYGCLFSVSHVNNLVEFSPTTENQFQHQLKTTADWGVGSWWANYFTGGLNHQVIHHVYPHHPSYAYPELSEWLLKEVGEKEYKVMGGSLFEALRSNNEWLRRMGRGEDVKHDVKKKVQ